METVYERFNSYDFQNDGRFQEGLKNIQDTIGSQEMLRMKIFYYNRFVELLDLDSYKQWTNRHSKTPFSEKTECLFRYVDDDQQDSASRHLQLDSAGQCQIEGSDTTLSFAEVFRLIQAGEEVPGLRSLNVTPTRQTPTVSQMPRRHKPWEKGCPKWIGYRPINCPYPQNK